MAFQSQVREALEQLGSAGLRRHPLQISGAQGPEITIAGRTLLCFCSNDYLGLAAHPTIAQAARDCFAREGVGAAASRLVTGTMDAHREAEAAFADFLETPSAVLFSTGYAANVGTIQALLGPGDALLDGRRHRASP